MRRPAAVLDDKSIERATRFARSLYERALQCARSAEGDLRQRSRLEQQHCLTCHYIATPRIGGAAMTIQPCGLCQADQIYSSTATDRLCLACAKAHALCKRCGGHIDMASPHKALSPPNGAPSGSGD